MDPFTYFPLEVCDSILSHLKGNELLNASTVSKTWYSIIGESSTAMQKLQLHLFWLRTPQMTYKLADLLVDSTRRYQNVVIRIYAMGTKDIKLIMEQECRNWKKVQLEHVTFISTTDLTNFLKIFQNTIEELELNNFYVRLSFIIKALNFPKLKKLKLTTNKVGNSTINEIFVSCKNLEKLCIKSDDISEKEVNPMKTILKNNRKLTHLEMSAYQVNSVFNEESSYDFKLESFISSSYPSIPSDANYKNLVTQQFGNLKVFTIDRIACPDTLKLIFKMPKLKCLNIGRIDTNELILSYNHLSVNKSIEELGYLDVKSNFIFMQCLVDAVPNLKKIDMYSLTQNMTEYMSSNLKELEILILRELEATNLTSRDLFPKLRQFQTITLSSTIEKHILSIPVDDCNPLVMLLKDSNYICID